MKRKRYVFKAVYFSAGDFDFQIEPALNEFGEQGFEIKHAISSYEQDWSTVPPTQRFRGTTVILQKEII